MSIQFEFELSNFFFVYKKSGGRMLRFTLTWIVRHPKAGLLAHAVDGCLLRKTARGDFRWTPPMCKFSDGVGGRQMNLISPDYYKLILNALLSTNYKEYLGYADAPPAKPQEVDPTLPKMVSGESEE